MVKMAEEVIVVEEAAGPGTSGEATGPEITGSVEKMEGSNEMNGNVTR